MDSSKIGNFIKEKRRQNNLTQNDLAEHLLTSRENISKWERGLAIPNTEYLKPLCEKLNVTVMELLTASDKVKEPEEEIVYKLLYKKEKYRKIIKYITFLLCAVLISFLGYFFITNYKSLRVYIISSDSEEIHLRDSLIVLSNDKLYLMLNSVENIDYMKIYYEKENEKYTLFGSNNNRNTFVSDIRGNKELNKKTIEKILDNLYLEFTMNDKTESIKLKVYKDYENNVVAETSNSKLEEENFGRTRDLSIENPIVEIIDKEDTWQIYGNNYQFISFNSEFSYNIKTKTCFYGDCDEKKISNFLNKYYKNGEWNQ